MNSIKIDPGLTEINLKVELFEEFGYQVAYSPGLNLAGQGDTEEEAIKDLKFTVKETIEWCIEHNTLFDMLLDLGWTVRKFPKPFYQPPTNTNYKVRPGRHVREIPVFA